MTIAALLSLWRKERVALWLFGVAAGSVVLAAPWILAVVPYNQLENRGALLSIEYLSLVRRMLFKADLVDALLAFVHRHISSDSGNWITLSLASMIFLAGGRRAGLEVHAGEIAQVDNGFGDVGSGHERLGQRLGE